MRLHSWVGAAIVGALGTGCWGSGGDSELLQKFEDGTPGQLIAYHSGQCVGVRDGSQANRAVMEQRSCDSSPFSMFHLQPTAGVEDSYSIVNAETGKCLDIVQESLENKATVIQYDCHGNQNQQFELIEASEAGPGLFQLRARHSDKCLDVPGGSMAEGTKLIQYACHSVADRAAKGNQLFAVDIVNDAGPDAGVDVCGDGVCTSDEKCETCPQDCGPCAGECGKQPGGSDDVSGASRLETSGRHLKAANGQPFFMLADTAWGGVVLNEAEMKTYLQTRANQGFNTILGPKVIDNRKTPGGDGNDGPKLPITGGTQAKYFSHLKKFAQIARDNGLHIIMILQWSEDADKYSSDAAAYNYAKEVSKFFCSDTNVSWFASGEFNQISATGGLSKADQNRFEELMAGLASGCPKALVFVHPAGAAPRRGTEQCRLLFRFVLAGRPFHSNVEYPSQHLATTKGGLEQRFETHVGLGNSV